MEDMKVLNDKELVEVSGGYELSDHFEPGVIDYARDSSIMEDKKLLNNEELEKVSGGNDVFNENTISDNGTPVGGIIYNSGASNFGGVAGTNNGGTIENCTNCESGTGTGTGYARGNGGVAGPNGGGMIGNC